MKPPKILEPGKINEINKYLLEKTGCFAFLISDNGWIYSEPKTGKGAVELWSIALYTIYHDYGCRYLRFMLDSNNKPYDSMDEMIMRSNRHMKTVQRVLRTNVAHGTLDIFTPAELMRIFFPRREWSLEEIPEDQWYRAAEKIRKESDDLVDILYLWADGYHNNRIIRNKFGASEDFKKSIDSRIMFNNLDNDFSRYGELSAKKILENQSRQLPNEKIEIWRNAISSLFLSKEIESPQDIIDKLKTYLFEIHQPMQRSSVTIGDSLGYSLSDLLS